MQIKTLCAENRIVYVDDVAQHCKQMFLDTANHLPIHKRLGWRIADLQLYTPRLPAQMNFKIFVLLEYGAGIVRFVTAIQHCQRTASEQLVHLALFRR